MSATDAHFPDSPAKMHIRSIFQANLSYRIGGAVTGLLQRWDGISTIAPNGMTGLVMVLQIAFRTVFSHLLREMLDISYITKTFRGIKPPFFHPILTAAIQLTSLRLFCALLFQQFHSSRIDGVWKFDDAMISLHRICQIPTNCQKK